MFLDFLLTALMLLTTRNCNLQLFLLFATDRFGQSFSIKILPGIFSSIQSCQNNIPQSFSCPCYSRIILALRWILEDSTVYKALSYIITTLQCLDCPFHHFLSSHFCYLFHLYLCSYVLKLETTSLVLLLRVFLDETLSCIRIFTFLPIQICSFSLSSYLL